MSLEKKKTDLETSACWSLIGHVIGKNRKPKTEYDKDDISLLPGQWRVL
jgi:hypothetical protein